MQVRVTNSRMQTRSYIIHCLYFMLFFLLFKSPLSAQTAEIPAGSGTVEDPYLITNLNNLYWLSQTTSAWATGKYFKQTANIDASATLNWHDNAGFSPIGNSSGSFKGRYDGQSYTISSLYINRPTQTDIGLFGYLTGGKISNLGIVNADITGSGTMGILAGRSFDTLVNCYTSGTVTGTGPRVGGLVGSLGAVILYSHSSANVVVVAAGNITGSGGLVGTVNSGKIYFSYATGNVSGAALVGGLAGSFESNSFVEDCFARGNVTATSNFAGGLTGTNAGTTSNIFRSYSTGTVNAANYYGGLSGGSSTTNIHRTEKSFWDTQTSGIATSYGGYGKTTVEMKTNSTFTDSGWNFTDIWNRVDTINNGYPYIRPYQTLTAPLTVTGSVTGLSFTTVTLNGTVNPGGDSTKAYFEYGTTTSYGMRTDTVEVGGGTTAVSVVKNIAGLTAGTLYHYRIVAFNSAGSAQGNDSVFTTLAQPAPVVVTLNTDSIAILSARFNGTVNPKGADTWYYFEYTGASVTQKTDTVFAGNGSVAVSVNKYVTGLNANTNYSVKLVAYNGGGITQGNMVLFKTKAYKPLVVTTAASQVTTSSGVVNGTVDANGDSSYYYFEYGTTSSFGSFTDTSSAGNGEIPLTRSKTITQLQPGVRYYYRIVAYNSGGKAIGLTSSFVTGASSLLIMTSPVGGEGFEPMTEHEITWTSQIVDSIKIEYSSNDGSSWSEVVNSYPAAGGSYIWNVPTGGTTHGRIQLSSKGITPVLTTTGTGLFSIGSSSFSELETGTESDINGASFSENNYGTMVGDSGLIVNTVDGGNTWTPQSPPPNSEVTQNLNSISSPSISTQFAVGDEGTILRTTNGGTTWSGTTLTDNDYHGVSFSDTLSGTMVGSNGVIQRTTDRGANWSAQTSGTDNVLRDIYSSNQTHSSIVGDEGTILFTSNGGGTWSTQNSGTIQNLNGVYFIKNAGLHQIGYAVGDSGVILKTTNGGVEWVQKTSNTRKNLKSLSFFDAQKGTVAGEGGLIMRTSNAGETWVAIVNPGNSNFSRVAMAEGGVATYVAGSGGKAYKDTLGLVPVELTSFTSSVKNGEVTLQWTTATETNNAGFEVERTSNKEWAKVGYVEGKGTTTQTSSYIYTQNNVNPGTYLYRLKQIDFDGKYSYSPEIEVTVTAPLEFVLSQNYPNPFNPSTLIKYQLPEATEVTLRVYDVQGSQVASLVNQRQDAGYYSVSFEAGKLSSGVYFYRLEAGANRKIMKMLLLK